MASYRRPTLPATAVAASPLPSDRVLKSTLSDQSLNGKEKRTRSVPQRLGGRLEPKKDSGQATNSGNSPIINISVENSHQPHNSNNRPPSPTTTVTSDPALADELDYITVAPPTLTNPLPLAHRTDKASRVLGIKHRRSMEPIPASARNSIVSTRSVREVPSVSSHVPTLPLTSLYVVSGLPKSPHTWTLADPDSVLGLHHSEGAVNRWWRPEVLGSTVSPGAGGGKKKKRGKGEEVIKGAGALSKQEVGKMLSKALKAVEVIASTLQPASTIHTFTFTLPAPNTPLAPTPSGDLLRASVLSTAENRASAATFAYPYADDPFARPSSAYLGPPSLLAHASHNAAATANATNVTQTPSNIVTYYGVCLTVWSHADAERSNAIRRTLEAGRSRKESAQSMVASRLKNLRADISGNVSDTQDPTVQARRHAKKSARGPWGDAETDVETENDGGISESDFEVASTVGHGPGESTLFLPGDTVFWLPYALTLVSRHPVYDLMRDYLTLSWARFSKDVQSHTLQISKILAHPAPRAGDLIKLDASPKNDGEASLEVIARFPGGLDFGRGLVDINFTMWPLFKCLNIDNILTICEIALAPTGRILFFSRYPAMLGIAVNTIKYLVELRGWDGIALPSVHSRDAKIYIDDPGPWIIGLSTEARYSVRPPPEVCVCDLDINYLSCPSPPVGFVSQKQQRDKFRQRLLAAFEGHYHPDHCIPSEFKEAFPAGRFRPICKIQAKRGASSAAVADQIKPPEWWHSTRIIQAFDSVLQDKFKKPSLLKRLSRFGQPKRLPHLSTAEQMIQVSIRKRATAFVDARDDLETKIGRLSRRLNFLMTESDLWRDKFVTFEQYAEKLSAEAGQLRGKINKEQRETKRLSGLVTLTAAEKTKLQNQLRETEVAHHEAVQELSRMKETMEKMEEERAAMVAEVEAQIERALASMAVDLEESDYTGSRPQSRLSSASGMRSRRASDAESRAKVLRSFATDSTLAEKCEEGELTSAPVDEKEPTTIEETEEEPSPPPRKKRFSASELEVPQDGMNAVDEGISLKSDKIAQKVLEIQQKLESALSQERRGGKRRKNGESEGEDSEATSVRSKKQYKKPSKISTKGNRTRSGTASSAYTGTDEGTTIFVARNAASSAIVENDSKTPTRGTFPETVHRPPLPRDRAETENIPPLDTLALKPLSPEQNTPTTPSLTPGASATTDESDTDFQSAYSTSPRDSYGFDNENLEDDQGLTISKSPNFHYPSATSTATSLPSEDTDTSEDSVKTPTITA
ncbi:hypothetical protein D9756_003768 [Leucocoprinus leucothites]|uniref:cDENN domain-containing protein n=1 Tax=Leucocoprinus leucothites TaxID=201217 RepID=A0A8H5D8S2_9AGAR|nr:hypothetical protein D9756_003768 [Leucoagaricus leucothites]